MLRQLVKKEQMMRIFSSSYDSAVMKRVLATHAPDGRQVDLEPLLAAIEETFRHAVLADFDSVIIITAQGAHSGNIHALPGDYKQVLLGFDDIIHTVSCELTCKSSGGTDAHTSTLAILNMLSSYSWEDKLVISLGAFAIIFGEFWLVAELFATNPLAKSIALLKHMPDVIKHYNILKARFDSINQLIKAMMDVTKCIITFKNLPHQYIQDDQPPKSTATADHIPTATYWSIKSMVACTSQLTSLLGMNYEYITATSEACELSSLTHKVHNIHEHLKSILVLCYQNIEEKQQEEYHRTRTRIIEAQNEEQASIKLSRTSSDVVISHQTQTRKEVGSHEENKSSGSVISHSQSMTDFGCGSGSGIPHNQSMSGSGSNFGSSSVISQSQSMSGSGSGSIIPHSQSMTGSGISHSQSMSGSGSSIGSIISQSQSMSGSGSGSLISHSQSMTESGFGSVISHSQSMNDSGSIISHSQSISGSGSSSSSGSSSGFGSVILHSQSMSGSGSGSTISHLQSMSGSSSGFAISHRQSMSGSGSAISHHQSMSGSGSGSAISHRQSMSGSGSVISHRQSMSDTGSGFAISHRQSMSGSGSAISHHQSMSGSGSSSAISHRQSMSGSGSVISHRQSMSGTGSVISHRQSMNDTSTGSVISHSQSMIGFGSGSGSGSIISHSQSMATTGSATIISHSQSMTRVVRSSSLDIHTTHTTSR
ncbi:cell wall protein AWA1 isoform X2 [Lactuca sativa]|uniref:cell wall protein AWA1 isoform X2 n=1 Tax=Lactuca sativa TaxID=4236 RepID=UPI000CD8AF51|nr:cell wall protein AWA1 isoform X2 [Lactuca sativa]